ncbi:MAG TPA: metal-dependent transcriptional regulator [Elusimicrobiota bacterium]|nr:metal-dependent transcriptional regulator [Elusimicrobiota bacterium]
MTEDKKFPIPTAEKEDIEEGLNVVWNMFEKKVRRRAEIQARLTEAVGEKALDLLMREGLLRESGDELVFSPEGERLAKDIIRRHRLAERLLSDVLSMARAELDSNACRLEHIISPEISESICTLLGHPRQCPHGSPIPSGDCCRREEENIRPIVVSLDNMKLGEEGRIAYLLLHDHPELHKLLSLGVIPGAEVRLHQTFPSFVLELGDSQLALEEAVARNIYVRKK